MTIEQDWGCDRRQQGSGSREGGQGSVQQGGLPGGGGLSRIPKPGLVRVFQEEGTKEKGQVPRGGCP